MEGTVSWVLFSVVDAVAVVSVVCGRRVLGDAGVEERGRCAEESVTLRLYSSLPFGVLRRSEGVWRRVFSALPNVL